ncbi:MAG: YbaN family protein [Pirellulales bacterium]
MAQSSPTAEVVVRSRLRRGIYAGLGVVLVGIGAVGVFVPGLPTAIWLMAASFFFARSSPALEARLIRNRFFGPYLKYLDRPAHMPRSAKISASLLMCGSVTISMTLLAWRGVLGWGFGIGLPVAALAGTWFVWNFGRRLGNGAQLELAVAEVCAEDAGETRRAVQAA